MIEHPRYPLQARSFSPFVRRFFVSSRPFTIVMENKPDRKCEGVAGSFFLVFQHCFFRCRSSVPKLKPRLRQNSLRRMLLLTNSATNC